MTDKTAAERIDSVAGAIQAIYISNGPDVQSQDQRDNFATAALAESNIAIATAILELAEAARERQ